MKVLGPPTGWDYLNISPTPTEEKCTSVTKEGGYITAMLKECETFKSQLQRVFGDRMPEYGAELGIKRFDHDFGTYYEVVVYYDRDCAEAEEFALLVEHETPEKWDEEALRELGKLVFMEDRRKAS